MRRFLFGKKKAKGKDKEKKDASKKKTSLAPPAQQPKKQQVKQPTTTQDQVQAQDDPRWKLLWETYGDYVVDPADARAVIDELIDDKINRSLSTSEIVYIQRNVRRIVRMLDQEKLEMAQKSVQERRMIINRPTWTRLFSLFYHSENDNENSDEKNVLDNAFMLMRHLSSDFLIDRTATIALESAQQAPGGPGSLDANMRHTAALKIPPPPSMTAVSSLQEPIYKFINSGINMRSLCFMLSLVLKTGIKQQQKLETLFYLCMDPKELQKLLETHPAGGIPTWLLEEQMTQQVRVGGGGGGQPSQPQQLPTRIISIASLGHYHHCHGVTVSKSNVLSVLSLRLGDFSDDKTTTTTPNNDEQTLTMEKYLEFCSKYVDDQTLDDAMDRLFGNGILLPCPSKERQLVLEAWSKWEENQKQCKDEMTSMDAAMEVWGGLGGLDGLGGLGHGILYCIDKVWWEDWTNYVGFWPCTSSSSSQTSVIRPDDKLTEKLVKKLDGSHDIPGTMGSYEAMKSGLTKGIDYILIPPVVWNVLSELYGGTSPPLPRMIVESLTKTSLERDMSSSSYVVVEPPSLPTPSMVSSINNDVSGGSDSDGFELVSSDTGGGSPQIPSAFSVVTHPWIIHSQICDPKMPYKRGNALGTIQIMVVPDQPLWRVFDEIVARFQLHAYSTKAFSVGMMGLGRLWKYVEYEVVTSASGGKQKSPLSRFGPWKLLCDANCDGVIPKLVGEDGNKTEIRYTELVEQWKKYTDNATVKSIGLEDRDRLMLEFAVPGKQSSALIWPREAAVKAAQARAQGSTGAVMAAGTNPVARKGGPMASKTTNVQPLNSCTLPGYGACGLSNLGNSGWMNAVLFCVSYTPLLRFYLLSGQYKSDLNKDNTLGTGGKLLEELANLLKIIWSGNVGATAPRRFRTLLGKCRSQYSAADQQDASEFLSYLFDVMHEDANRVMKKPYVHLYSDEFVKANRLSRVSDEAWRRFQRRNRSMMVDVTMGQLLSTITCSACNHSRRNFDTFNMLDLPIPSSSTMDVYFKITLFRRGVVTLSAAQQPNNCFIVAIPRLADVHDLRREIGKKCGKEKMWQAGLRLFRADEDEADATNTDAASVAALSGQTRLTAIAGKVGTCATVAKMVSMMPIAVVAFEASLISRPPLAEHGGSDDNNESVDENLRLYGDNFECRSADTDPLVLAKAMSRRLWPRKEDDLKVGLRVDGRDQRGHWYPGSVIAIIDDVGKKRQVRVHFDNFSSKWDEKYTMDQFLEKDSPVQPLYSKSKPNAKLPEFFVHHRNGNSQMGSLFGHPLRIQCFDEWSCARAGAHILMQVVSHFLIAEESEAATEHSQLREKAMSTVNELIDVLVNSDRDFVRLALGAKKGNDYLNPVFDGTNLSKQLVQEVSRLSAALPFEILLSTAPPAPTPDATDTAFPFVLNRCIRNLLSARHSIVLQWRDPTLYVRPKTKMDDASTRLLAKIQNEGGSKQDENDESVDISECLSSFVAEKKVDLSHGFRCPLCKQNREATQDSKLWRLPDLLAVRLKRFNCSARYREKINTLVNFPLTGLDLNEYCHIEASSGLSNNDAVYDLIGVINHFGGMTGGAYISYCKATPCSKIGQEDLNIFQGSGFGEVDAKINSNSWKLKKDGENKELLKQYEAMSKSMSKSAEPLWLEMHDEDIEPMSTTKVVSPQAYLLIYRKRRLRPSNVAKYATLE